MRIEETVRDRVIILILKEKSQSEFARKRNIARHIITTIVTREFKITDDTLTKICAYDPNLNARWLLTGVGEMYHPPTDCMAIGTPSVADLVQENEILKSRVMELQSKLIASNDRLFDYLGRV